MYIKVINNEIVYVLLTLVLMESTFTISLEAALTLSYNQTIAVTEMLFKCCWNFPLCVELKLQELCHDLH